MKIKAVFKAKTITLASQGPSTQIYPVVAPAPTGVGEIRVGEYVVAHLLGSRVSGNFTFTRTNTHIDDQGHLIGQGEHIYRLKVNDHIVVITDTYSVRTLDPTNPFSIDLSTGYVTSAKVDGCLYTGTIKNEILDGGLTINVTFKLCKIE
jgi:hypothetical protein